MIGTVSTVKNSGWPTANGQYVLVLQDGDDYYALKQDGTLAKVRYFNNTVSFIGEGTTTVDYINEYLENAKNDEIHKMAVSLGLDESLLRDMMTLKLDKLTLNEFGRFDRLKATVDKATAKTYFESVEGKKIPMPKVNIKVDNLLRDFILGKK